MQARLSVDASLPADRERALLVGRAWLPAVAGPALVLLRGDDVLDLSRVAPTSSALMNLADPVAAVRGVGTLPRIGAVADLLASSVEDVRDRRVHGSSRPTTCRRSRPAASPSSPAMLERVIEERARGDASKAEAVRQADGASSAATSAR